jgi:hypothetical protein
MASPVFGFLPVLPFRWDTEKVPKPEIFTFSLFFKAAQISSNSPPIISSALCRGNSNRFASESIKSAFVIVPPSPSCQSKKYRAMGFYNSSDTGCQTTRYLAVIMIYCGRISGPGTSSTFPVKGGGSSLDSTCSSGRLKRFSGSSVTKAFFST